MTPSSKNDSFTSSLARPNEDQNGSCDGATNALNEITSLVRVLGVDYIHKHTADGGELYITEQGMVVENLLDPDKWIQKDWFSEQRERLDGSSAAYALPTREIDGKNIGLVVRYNRVGEQVPIETAVVENATCVEFNGPFEELALIKELFEKSINSNGEPFAIQRPLAIYIPPERYQPSQLGRTEWRIERKIGQHPGITLDIMREYIVIYEWIYGLDAWQAHNQGYLSKQEVVDLVDHAKQELAKSGFRVLDMKPEHLIVEPCSSTKLLKRSDEIFYSLIDHELLERTVDGWQARLAEHRKQWSQRRKRLNALEEDENRDTTINNVTQGRKVSKILDVNYIHGHVESTGGALWVVGDQDEYFDDYLPERWRSTPRMAFADMHESYFTTSKDGLRLVWKVSQVGERARSAGFGADGFRVLAWGINSPFEEVSLALHLNKRGITTPVPLAIYRTGHMSHIQRSCFDLSRYESHMNYRAIDGSTILDSRFNYITLWEHWAGPEGQRDEDRPPEFRSINLAMAQNKGIVSSDECKKLLENLRNELQLVNVKFATLAASHVLVALNGKGEILDNPDGRPLLCLCNFKYLRDQTD